MGGPNPTDRLQHIPVLDSQFHQPEPEVCPFGPCTVYIILCLHIYIRIYCRVMCVCVCWYVSKWDKIKTCGFPLNQPYRRPQTLFFLLFGCHILSKGGVSAPSQFALQSATQTTKYRGSVSQTLFEGKGLRTTQKPIPLLVSRSNWSTQLTLLGFYGDVSQLLCSQFLAGTAASWQTIGSACRETPSSCTTSPNPHPPTAPPHRPSPPPTTPPPNLCQASPCSPAS